MPEPTYPPFSEGATLIPRQLNRWLDVNPQGGALTRSRKYITLPTYSGTYTWSGYSQIVKEFNFTVPNNFSLKNIPVISSTDHVLCISWVDSSSITHRYKVFGDGVFYFDIPDYTGQMIGKSFKFEVWSTSSGTYTSNATYVLYTSVLASFDYRFSDDTDFGTYTASGDSVFTLFTVSGSSVVRSVAYVDRSVYDVKTDIYSDVIDGVPTIWLDDELGSGDPEAIVICPGYAHTVRIAFDVISGVKTFTLSESRLAPTYTTPSTVAKKSPATGSCYIQAGKVNGTLVINLS